MGVLSKSLPSSIEINEKEEYIRERWAKKWPNFSLEEVLSPDGLAVLVLGYLPIQVLLMDKLEELRRSVKKPVLINYGRLRLRGYRSISENARVEMAAKNSWHCKGCAADVTVEGLTPHEVGELAAKIGFTGIGIYDTFTHIDVRFGEIARWDYRGKKLYV